MIKYDQPDPQALCTTEASDISTAVLGFVNMLRAKSWKLPSRFAVSIYNILIRFMENHYKRPEILEIVYSVRDPVRICLYLGIILN